MERQPVESAHVAAAGYDKETETLEVEFHSGAVYVYTGVPEMAYEAFMASDSKGRFVRDTLAGYPYERSE